VPKPLAEIRRDDVNRAAPSTPSSRLAGSSKWSLVRLHADRIVAPVASATAGSYVEVEIPFEPRPDRS
jgi:hypothetical protein